MKQVQHMQDIFPLSGFANTNNRSLAECSHKAGRQVNESTQDLPTGP